MKNLSLLFSLFVMSLLSSCQKEEVPTPASTAVTPVSTIGVEYRVFSVSGHFTATFNVIENGQMTEKTYSYDRTQVSMKFDGAAGPELSVKAHNSIPSGDEVRVEIWVNGSLFKSGTANAPGAIASAEGEY